MLNNRLALHYGIDNVNGPEIRRVSLPKSSVRGGAVEPSQRLEGLRQRHKHFAGGSRDLGHGANRGQ